MNRLAYLIVFTKNYEASRDFYSDGLMLETRNAQDDWTEFDTLGALLALHRMDDDQRQGTMLRFETAHLVRDMSILMSRGVRFDGDVIESGAGRLVNLWDPEDNLITLFEPAQPIHPGLGPAIGRVILNCEDFHETVAFYRDKMGLAVTRQADHWVEFDTGLTRLAVHTRPHDQSHPRHAEQPIAWTIETDDLNATVDGIRSRGLRFMTAPVSEDFGAYAELVDPDGRIVVLREPPADPSLEEQLAEAYEDDRAPRRSAFRKPVAKGTLAVSRLVNKPGYRSKKRAVKKKAAARPARSKAAGAKHAGASTRGAGANGARLKPRKARNTTRAKVKPATGRLKKAERRSVERKRSATARASRTMPVKRASANRGRARAASGRR